MISERDLELFYKNADLREPFFVYPYRNNGIYESVLDSEKKCIELKIIDSNIKLDLLPLILNYADEPQSMTYFKDYDANGDRDLISVKTTCLGNENNTLFKVFQDLSSINEDFKSFFTKLKNNKEKIDFYYFEILKKY
ncbi:hypothetical protein [Tenacibaculum ovolyticum]|uniref:hypothetical protein n=1 Tax=Tenacibaculum ovolyticum TaxID=104270 RepID=UPI0007EC4158|nr:hypothetical protein [Tenacibaculum ovolyticum]